VPIISIFLAKFMLEESFRKFEEARSSFIDSATQSQPSDPNLYQPVPEVKPVEADPLLAAETSSTDKVADELLGSSTV